jgi:indole-3-glycerol phosphate synthase
MSILDEIFEHKRSEVAGQQAAVPLAAVRAAAESTPRPADFAGALRACEVTMRRPALIAEVKHRSPSRGLLAPGFDPLHLARTYAANGAAAVSVLTDERYFGGSLEDLRRIAAELGSDRPPLLRKEFVCDPYQIYEARAAGAAAILLIVACLAPAQLAEFQALAHDLGLAALVEVHSAEELEIALQCEPALVGVNNRDLRDFTVDVNTTLRLRPLIPAGTLVVAESGLKSPGDLPRLAAAGVDAVLIGEGLVTAPDVAAQVRAFTGYAEPLTETARAR